MISATIEVKVQIGPDAGKPSDARPLEVQVQLEPEGGQSSGYRFVHIKIGDEPSIPIPTDKPASRRLLQALASGAKAKGEGPAVVNVTIGDELPIAVSADTPIPRIFVQALIAAAKVKLGDKDAPPIRAGALPNAGTAQVSMVNPPPGPMPNAPDETSRAIMTAGPTPNKRHG